MRHLHPWLCPGLGSDDCGRAASGDYFVAYSCKGRGVCPSCNTRRMVETAGHLTDHVFPRLMVRQWVLSVTKRLRFLLQRDGATLNMVLRIFLRVIAQALQSHSPSAASIDKAALYIGAVALAKPQVHIHRFGSSLNGHVQRSLPAAVPAVRWANAPDRFSITEGMQIRRILDHSGVDSEPPHIAPARGPLLWDECDAQTDEGVHIEPDWDLAAQPAPNFEVDQRVSW